MGQTSARRTSVRRASAKRTSVGRSFAGRTFAWRTSALRTSAGRTSAGRTSAGRTSGANLEGASLHEANLTEANLIGAVLSWANLIGAVLIGANLSEAALVQTDLIGADLTGCRIYGISAWNVKLNDRTKQQVLIITPHWEPEVTVDDLEVAQFVYLLLHNDKIRRVIDIVGKKGVLLLGRFTEGRIEVLERLREELRQRGYLPIVFNFDKPKTKTLTETIWVLAGLSRFVIADVTDPHSVPAELQAVVPTVMVPFLPIIEKGKKPFALLEDLRIRAWRQGVQAVLLSFPRRARSGPRGEDHQAR
jgi:Pentapeptide repeats (8 copies)